MRFVVTAFRQPRVEMLPLIDMFFILLAFFIFGVFSMTMQQGIAVELPRVATAVASKEDSAVISLTADGKLFLNHEPSTIDTLEAALREWREQYQEAVVIIQADRMVPHGTVIEVLDRIRLAGINRVSFATEPMDHDG